MGSGDALPAGRKRWRDRVPKHAERRYRAVEDNHISLSQLLEITPPYIDLMGRLEEPLAEKDGPLTFFGLYRREYGLGHWDLLISAPWLSHGRKASIDLILPCISEVLTRSVLLELGTLVVLRPDELPALNLPASFKVEHGRVHLRNITVNGMAIADAYVITYNPDAVRSETAAIEEPRSGETRTRGKSRAAGR